MSWTTGSAIIVGAVLGVSALGVAVPILDDAPSAQDRTWLGAAHQSNLAGIAAGTAAVDRASTDDVRWLGARTAEMHRSLNADLTAAAERLGVALPDGPSAQQQAELDAVMARQGAEFDVAWVAQQLGWHYTSSAQGRQELTEGDDEAVVELAEESTPVIDQHLDDLTASADNLGVPSSVPSGTGGQVAAPRVLVGGALVGAGALALIASLLVTARRRAWV